MPEAIPPLLNSFVSTVPEHSLTLITSVLGATSNWLLLRFLYPVLSNTSQGPSTSQNAGDRKARVVLVSFLRGLDFWKAESRRLVRSFTTVIDSYPFPFWFLFVLDCNFYA